MANKPTTGVIDADTILACPDCGCERFQVHERGTVTRSADGVLSVDYDELALTCQGCHHVLTQDVRGVIDYQA